MKKDRISIGGEEALSVVLVMRKLGFTRPTLMLMVKNREIGYYKIGARYWFTYAQITKYQKGCRVNAK